MDLEHWIFGPHHAWTEVGSNKLVRMWQPYNGFEIFAPGSFKDGIADAEPLHDVPPSMCKKDGKALFRIDCQDDGYPVPKNESQTEPDMSPNPADSDLRRARSKVPRDTHKGTDFSSMSEKLNSFIKQYGNAKECSEFAAEELQRFQLIMMLLRAPELDAIYQDGSDRRALRGDEDAHGKRWEELLNVAKKLGGRYQEMHRDGHCHEAVMWFAHHMPEDLRRDIAQRMAIPLLPYQKHYAPEAFASSDEHAIHSEYLNQVSCQDCHTDENLPVAAV